MKSVYFFPIFPNNEELWKLWSFWVPVQVGLYICIETCANQQSLTMQYFLIFYIWGGGGAKFAWYSKRDNSYSNIIFAWLALFFLQNYFSILKKSISSGVLMAILVLEVTLLVKRGFAPKKLKQFLDTCCFCQ